MSSSGIRDSFTEVDEALEYARKRFGRNLNRWFMTQVIERSDKLRAEMHEQGKHLGVHEAKRTVLDRLVAEFKPYWSQKALYSSAAGHVFALRKKPGTKTAGKKREQEVNSPPEYNAPPHEEEHAPPAHSLNAYERNAARIGERD